MTLAKREANMRLVAGLAYWRWGLRDTGPEDAVMKSAHRKVSYSAWREVGELAFSPGMPVDLASIHVRAQTGRVGHDG